MTSPLALERRDETALGPALFEEWSALVARDPDAALFQTPEWVAAWWRHVGHGELRLVLVRRAGELVALAPIVRERESRRGLPAKTLRFAGDPESDRSGLLASDDEALARLVDELAAASREVDLVELAEVAAGTRLDEHLRARWPHALREPCGRAPVVSLDASPDELAARYSKTLRTRLKRARKRQAKECPLAFRRWRPTVDEVPALIERLRPVELAKVAARRERGERIEGIFEAPRRRAFFEAAARAFAERGWLDVGLLEDDDRVAAYRFGFRFRGSFLDYNLAHDPEYSSLSPGRVLLDELVLDSAREGLDAVDASRGSLSDPHLLSEWPCREREHLRWSAFGRSLRGWALERTERTVKPLVRRLRRRS